MIVMICVCDLLICDCGFFQVATIGSVIGHLANPLLVLPLKPAMAADSWGSPKSVEPEVPSKLVGSGYQAFEDSVLMKLQKVYIPFAYALFRFSFRPVFSSKFTNYHIRFRFSLLLSFLHHWI